MTTADPVAVFDSEVAGRLRAQPRGGDLVMRRARWNAQLSQLTGGFVARVRAELAVQQDALPAEVVDAIQRLLADSLSSWHTRDIVPVLEAASYLGLISETLVDFTSPSANPPKE